MTRITPSKDKERKGRTMVNENIYIAISIALTGIVMLALMSFFSIPA